jgi:hypothetical protein
VRGALLPGFGSCFFGAGVDVNDDDDGEDNEGGASAGGEAGGSNSESRAEAPLLVSDRVLAARLAS